MTSPTQIPPFIAQPRRESDLPSPSRMPLASKPPSELPGTGGKPNPVSVAREGVAAIEQLIAERDELSRTCGTLQRHYDVNRSTIASLETQVSLLENKLSFYQNLSTSLTTKLNTVGIVCAEAIRESRDAAMAGKPLTAKRDGYEESEEDKARLENLVKRLAPDPKPEEV